MECVILREGLGRGVLHVEVVRSYHVVRSVAVRDRHRTGRLDTPVGLALGALEVVPGPPDYALTRSSEPQVSGKASPRGVAHVVVSLLQVLSLRFVWFEIR